MASYTCAGTATGVYENTGGLRNCSPVVVVAAAEDRFFFFPGDPFSSLLDFFFFLLLFSASPALLSPSLLAMLLGFSSGEMEVARDTASTVSTETLPCDEVLNALAPQSCCPAVLVR